MTELPMSEDQLEAAILDAAAHYGWKVMHVRAVAIEGKQGRFYATPTTSPGYPDLTLGRDGQALHLELKGTRGRPTLDQLEWLHALGGWLIYPRHLDAVLDILRIGLDRVPPPAPPPGVRVDARGSLY